MGFADQNKRYQAQLDAWKAVQDARKPMFEAAIRYSEMAIRSLLIISGGAAVALAGFAGGSLKADAHPIVLQALSSSIWWFALSAAGAVAVAGLAYLSQIVIVEAPEPWNNRIGGGIRAVAVLLFITCLGFFVMGAYAASSALNPTQPIAGELSWLAPAPHAQGGEAMYSWITSSDAANIGQFVGGIGGAITAFVAVAAAFVAYRQLVVTPQSQREINAREIWKDYLRLCIEYPELANGGITQESPDFARYEWFVSFMLDACEEILLHVEDEGGWLHTIDAQLGYHKEHLTSAYFSDAYMSQWSAKMQDRIRKIAKRASDA